MFEKDLGMGFLLDFYGQMLTERKRAVMNMYYNEDLSLAEIASEVGISRQGVRDLIKKSEAELSSLESSLGLARRFVELRNRAEAVESKLAEYPDLPCEVRSSVLRLTEELKK